MEDIKTVEIKEDILSRNNAGAQELRESLIRRKIFYLNVMSSPGSGKTTLITELVNRLKSTYRIGVIEADLDGAVDARTIARETGVKTVQINTAGACHITYQMSAESPEALGADGLDVIILENIGNLVCPAEFDTGSAKNLVLLSVPEGDDKPLKYPLMFEVASAVAITKTDVSGIFDFSAERAVKNIKKRNPSAPVFVTCAKTGEGLDALEAYIKSEIEKIKL